MDPVSEKWQKEWSEAKIFHALRSDKPKFYLVFAYPTVSGTLHIGHARSYSIPDIVARYKRMKGYNVFFPLGFHATGVDCAKIYEECKADYKKGAKKYGIEEEAAKKFTSPLDVDKYLEKRIINAFKRLGLSIDESTATSTIDPHYNKFIQWQYRRLNSLGLLKQGDYVLPYCNECQQVISIDAAQAEIAEGEDAEVKEYEVIKFKDEKGIVYPIATLRPETIFGVTNLWVNPDSYYVEAKVDNETWIISEHAVEKFVNLGKKIEIKRKIKGEELKDISIINPANGKSVKIIPATFVDSSEATGVVMSVPAHDPYDYMHYKEATNADDSTIPFVVDMHLDGIPSAVILKKHNGDAEAAVKELYKLEYRGTIRKDIPVIGGMPTAKAKDAIISYLSEKGVTDKIYEFTVKQVKDRFGHPVIIKKISGQWFVNYANKQWKELAKECVEQMNTYPPEYKKELPSIIDWLRERPLIRKRGLGTEFPFAKGWMIEALSDSTIYMAFYVVSRAINTGKLKVDEIDDAFFDYIYLGKEGNLKCKKEVADEIRKDFEYFYPLDLNFGGKEHKTVHFPFFIFHHAAIFERRFWPKGIFVNWHLIVEGEKMSKSKGNVVFWDDAIDKYGPDAIRFYMAHGTNQWNDFDWKSAEMDRYYTHLESLKKLFDDLIESAHSGKDNSEINKWGEAIFAKRLKMIETELERYEIRNAASIAFFEIKNDIQWLKSRGGNVSKELLGNWLKILSPFIPHTAEEYWHKLGNNTLISSEKWPVVGEPDQSILKAEEEIRTIVDDLNNLTRIMKEKKTKLYIYSIPNEVQYIKNAAEFIKDRFNFDNVAVYSVADKEKYDPLNKASKAKPSKPAIYLE
ncbi:MAG: leucine--tRNA ligase [Candidatus Micrarchaeia archaeon]